MQRRTIILIDDSKSEMRLLHEAFKHVNYKGELVSHTDPEAALQYIIAHVKEIFMIVCDINMPRLTGPDLLEKINASPTLKMQCIPFIFLSTSAQQRDVEHAFQLSAQGYFQKPMTIEELADLFTLMIAYWQASKKPSDVHAFH